MSKAQHIPNASTSGRNDFWSNQSESMRSLIRGHEGITPLVVFRILFGLVVAYGAVRFVAEGWIELLLVEPKFYFSFWGFDWIPRPSRTAAYVLYGVIAASALAVSLGYRYRWSVAILFVSFTYAELLDATNYLNHYYLVILLTILLFFTPAHRAFSLDLWAGRVNQQLTVARRHRYVLLAQLAIVYFFAGLAKVNADWLVEAMPMAIWLPERAHYPIVGGLFEQPLTAYAFSWAGCLYDLTIVGFLLWRPTRKWAYLAVIVFHMMTWALFNIGLFPLIMMTTTLLFFSPQEQMDFLQKIKVWLLTLNKECNLFIDEVVLWNSHPNVRLSTTAVSATGRRRLGLTFFDAENLLGTQKTEKCEQHGLSLTSTSLGGEDAPHRFQKLMQLSLLAYFLIQLALPLRTIFYPGPAAWGEEGYRFGWRVMLVEKAGNARFTITDQTTGRRMEIDNLDYLTPYQEKQMAIQPDFILQFAKHIAEDFKTRHLFTDPAVTVESYVSLNGRRSRRLIDPQTNLVLEDNGLSPKPWILPFEQ